MACHGENQATVDNWICFCVKWLVTVSLCRALESGPDLDWGLEVDTFVWLRESKIADHPATTCMRCNITCHELCLVESESRRGCGVLAQGRCRVCPRKCDWTHHVKATWSAHVKQSHVVVTFNLDCRMYHYRLVEKKTSLKDLARKHGVDDEDALEISFGFRHMLRRPPQKGPLLKALFDEYQTAKDGAFDAACTACKVRNEMAVADAETVAPLSAYIQDLMEDLTKKVDTMAKSYT